MNKGISFYFGFVSTPEERAKAIKEAGFDCVITSDDERWQWQNDTIENQVKLFKKYGLKLSSLHARYIKKELPEFFKEGEIGDRLEENLIKDLHVAKKYGFTCVVLHLEGSGEIGYARLRRALKVAEQLNVPIAIENLSKVEWFVKTFENVQSPMLKFCYDSGHNNCFTPDFDFLGKYGDKLFCLHLHDNMGKNDDHTLNKYGNIDWDMLAEKLAPLGEVNLDYEMLLKVRENETLEDVARETCAQALELEKKILEKRKGL